MYAFSTKSDTEKHGYDGFARIIQWQRGAEIIRSDPPNLPNSRSILDLQKNGTDAETGAELRADGYAEYRAVVCADPFAEYGAKSFATPAGLSFPSFHRFS